MADVMDRNNLTEGVIWKKLLMFFFPIWGGMLFQQLYNTVDALIVGKFVGASALAAVGGSPAVLINLVIGFFTGLSSGASVIIAQEYGAGNGEGLSRTLHTAATFFAAVGLCITVLGFILAPAALKMVSTPEDIIEDSTLYMRIYFTGAIPMLVYNLFSGTLQAIGQSGKPFRFLIASCVTNIVLDIVFVVVLGMGVAGVAWATVISMLLCFCLAGATLLKADGPQKLVISKMSIDRIALRRILRIGIPSGVQSAMYSISNVIIQSSVNSFGTTIVAAWTATGKLDGLYWCTSNSFGVAICSFVGQCYGAGKIDRMKKSVRTCLLIALGSTVFLSFFLMTIARPAYNILLDDQDVIDNAVKIMTYFVPYYFTWTFVEVLSGSLRGTGDTFIPMVITLVGTCAVRIVWMLTVVPVYHTIAAVSIIYVISWIITGAAFSVYYLRGRWNHKAASADRA